MTPITIPAIAPPLSPLLDVVETPAALPAPEADADGVMNGTVVVAEPVDVTVVAALLVGRMNAVAVDDVAVVVMEAKYELLSPPPLLAAHWPAYAQYCPTAQQMVPQGLSFIELSQEMPVTAAATAVVLSAPKKELYVDVTVVASLSIYVVV